LVIVIWPVARTVTSVCSAYETTVCSGIPWLLAVGVRVTVPLGGVIV